MPRPHQSARSWLTGLTLAIVSTGCAVNANTREGRIPGEHHDCRAAASLLSRGKATKQTFATLGWCDVTGPTALAEVWQRPLPDTSRLGQFLFASGNISDARIFDAAFGAAKDSSRRPVERAAALLVLIAQIEPGATVTLGPALRNEPWRAGLLHQTHATQIPGTKPLPADARARVRALSQKLAAGRPKGDASWRDPVSAAVQTTAYELQRMPGEKKSSAAMTRPR